MWQNWTSKHRSPNFSEKTRGQKFENLQSMRTQISIISLFPLQSFYWWKIERLLIQKNIPLKMTAIRLPVGSHASDWTVPPALKNEVVSKSVANRKAGHEIIFFFLRPINRLSASGSKCTINFQNKNTEYNVLLKLLLWKQLAISKHFLQAFQVKNFLQPVVTRSGAFSYPAERGGK